MTVLRWVAAVIASAIAAAVVLTATSPDSVRPTLTAASVKPLRYSVAGDAEFVDQVHAILEAPSSWTSELVVPDGGGPVDFYIWLAEPAEALSRCGPVAGRSEYDTHHISCAGGNLVVINSDRWFNGRDEPPIIAPMWRRLIINHEVGHMLGLPDGGPCTVMNPKVCPGEWPISPDDGLRQRAREWLATRSPSTT